MFGPIIPENDPPFFAPWVTSAHQYWKKSEALVDKSLALYPRVKSLIPGSPSLLDEILRRGPIFWDALKPEPLPVKPSGAPRHKNHTTRNPSSLALVQPRNSHKKSSFLSLVLVQPRNSHKKSSFLSLVLVQPRNSHKKSSFLNF